ncbi:hypothetical protein GCM10007352_12480 [Mucilaginibacter phyllosphaerae]|nr:hypothetical protein GCM10007352_12480 [Mucilaginibacter phyllosphaerae]
MNKITTSTNSYERSFKYTYDEFNRYKTADYSERTPTGTLYNKNSGGFSEAISGYDVNGNIQGLRHAVIMFIRAEIDVAVLDNLSVEVLFELIKQDRQRH